MKTEKKCLLCMLFAAQFAFLLYGADTLPDPQIGTVHSGAVQDVRAVASHDRRYVTIDNHSAISTINHMRVLPIRIVPAIAGAIDDARKPNPPVEWSAALLLQILNQEHNRFEATRQSLSTDEKDGAFAQALPGIRTAAANLRKAVSTWKSPNTPIDKTAMAPLLVAYQTAKKRLPVPPALERDHLKAWMASANPTGAERKYHEQLFTHLDKLEQAIEGQDAAAIALQNGLIELHRNNAWTFYNQGRFKLPPPDTYRGEKYITQFQEWLIGTTTNHNEFIPLSKSP